MTPPLSIWARPAFTAKLEDSGGEVVVDMLEGVGFLLESVEVEVEVAELVSARLDWERKAEGRSGKVVVDIGWRVLDVNVYVGRVVAWQRRVW